MAPPFPSPIPRMSSGPFLKHLYGKSCIVSPEHPINIIQTYTPSRGGRVVRWCWVNFQCRGVLLIWIIVRQGPTKLAVGAGGGCLDIFSLVYHFSFLSPSLWETARYRLKHCLKGPLSPKQPTTLLRTLPAVTLCTLLHPCSSLKNSYLNSRCIFV